LAKLTVSSSSSNDLDKLNHKCEEAMNTNERTQLTNGQSDNQTNVRVSLPVQMEFDTKATLQADLV